MKTNFRKLLSMLVVLATVLSMVPAVLAVETVDVGSSAELIAAMAEGGQIKLTAGFMLTEKVEVPAGVTAVLDLNGQTIESEDSTAYYIYNQGTLTVKDSAGGGKIDMVATVNSGDRATCIQNEGDLTIAGGELISMTAEACAKTNYTIFSKVGNVNITGGTLKAVHSGTANISVYALGLGSAGTATTIRNATISVDSQCNNKSYYAAPIYLTSDAETQVTIESGTFTATMKHSVGASLIRAGSNTSKATLTVEGGNFDIGVGTKGLIVNMSESQVSVTGGTFPVDVSAYLPEGYTQNVDGSVTEGSAEPEEPGNWEVGTSADFCAAMKKGGQIKLTDSFELTAKAEVPAGVTATLDLNGQTITSNNGEEHHLSNEGTLTIVDSVGGGGISVQSAGKAASVIAVNNNGTLTIEDGTFSVASGNRTAYALFSKGKSVTINGGTFAASYTKANGAYQAQTLGLGGTGSTVVINDCTVTADSASERTDTRCATMYVLSGSDVQITVNGGSFTAPVP